MINKLGSLMDEFYSYLFVFQESIEKTNIQRGELISLIELTDEQNNVITEVIEVEDIIDNNPLSFKDDLINGFDHFIAKIAFLSQTAVVFSNYQLNLKEIIRRAGYIQSTGEFVFLSKWEFADKDAIIEKIVEFCSIKCISYNLIFYKATDNKEIDEKLGNLLIDDTRYHIGTSPFRSAERTIKKEIGNKLIEQNILKRGDEPIFIIKDTSKIKDNSPLTDLYHDRNIVEYSICYLSTYKKDNSIHSIDSLKEAKPFWGGIYTTPHKLMNAMLNLAKVKEDSIVVDPFAHTGTLVIEASQIGCTVKAYDLHEIQGAQDNYDLFCSGSKFLLETCKLIYDKTNDNNLTSKLRELLQDSICLNSQGLPEIRDGKRIENLIEESNSVLKIYENRLYYYLLRRYLMEKERSANLKEVNPIDFVKKHVEIEKNIDEKFNGKIEHSYYYYFGNQLDIFERANINNGFPIIKLNDKEEIDKFFPDNFYKTNRIGFVNKTVNKPTFEKKDILLDNYDIEENTIDAIVTDPPYGYGEGIEDSVVGKIYTALFEKSFKWIRPYGYLVFCALDKVKTGRKSGLLFTENIIEIANLVARKLDVTFDLNYFYPNQKHKSCLYYWKSKYALNRSIIVLRINKKPS